MNVDVDVHEKSRFDDILLTKSVFQIAVFVEIYQPIYSFLQRKMVSNSITIIEVRNSIIISWAINLGKVVEVERLMKNGIDPNTLSDAGKRKLVQWTPLNQKYLVIWFTEVFYSYILLSSKLGNAPLIFAAAHGKKICPSLHSRFENYICICLR